MDVDKINQENALRHAQADAESSRQTVAELESGGMSRSVQRRLKLQGAVVLTPDEARQVREALDGLVPRCGYDIRSGEQCDERAIYLHDHPECPYSKCNKHKEVGAEVDDDVVAAIAALVLLEQSSSDRKATDA